MKADIQIPEVDDLVAQVAKNTSGLESLAARVAKLESPPIVVTPPPIPPIPGNSLNTKDFPRGDLGQSINAADEQLGDREGTIIIEPGTIATKVVLRPKRTLRFQQGQFPVALNDIWFGAILLNHDTKVFGAGRDKTEILEPEHGYIVIGSVQEAEPSGPKRDGPYTHSHVTNNLELAHFTIRGRNAEAEGGVRSTIQFGNARNVRGHDLQLIDTSCLGFTMGGNTIDGNHAEDWVVSNCIFSGVASQALNVVNGRKAVFASNTFLRSGKLHPNGILFEGMTCIDLEPNTPDDICQDVTITNNLVDSSDCKQLHGNGILAQDTVGTTDYGPVFIENNRVIGGPLLQDFAGWIASGIFVGGKFVKNVTVRKNFVQRVGQCGYRFEGGSNILAEDNEAISTGTGGANAVEIADVLHSKFRRFKAWVHPDSLTANDQIVEMRGSDFNEFEGNTPKPRLIGKNSRIV